jgi:1,4-dihydroxy-2-naphthoate octaprenyltransferase
LWAYDKIRGNLIRGRNTLEQIIAIVVVIAGVLLAVGLFKWIVSGIVKFLFVGIICLIVYIVFSYIKGFLGF